MFSLLSLLYFLVYLFWHALIVLQAKVTATSTFNFADSLKNVKVVATMSLDSATTCNATTDSTSFAMTLNFALANNLPAVFSIFISKRLV